MHIPARSLPRIRPLGLAALGASLLWLLSACGGSEGGGPTGSGGTKPGNLTVTIDGLPSGASASVTVTGPGGYSRALTGTETLSGLAAGAYTVSAAEALAGSDRFAPGTASASVTVSGGATATASVSYALMTGALAVTPSGLPPGANPAFGVTGPAGFSRSLIGAATVRGLAPGSYMVRATSVEAEGHTWAPTTSEREVQVAASPTAAAVPVAFAIATGAITATVTGLPNGTAATAQVSGPSGFSRAAPSGTTLTNLVPGSYSITSAAVTVGGERFVVAAPVQVTVTASETPQQVQVPFSLATGRLDVAFSGLPTGSTGSARVTGPGGYARNVAGAETISGLTPGTYTVAPNDVLASGVTWGVAGGAVQVSVSATSTAASVTLAYAVTRGSLSLVVNGLPQSIPATVTITGPANYSSTATATGVITGLAPGTYTVTAVATAAGLHTYAGTPTTQQVTIAASATPATATVTYALASAILSLTVNGLPSNVQGDITVTGPGGFSNTLSATTLLTGLAPGAYTIASRTVQNGAAFYAPNPMSQVVNLVASTSAQSAAVTYASANGTLVVTINGLPGGVNADVRLTGPSGFARTLTASQTLAGVQQGLYTAAVNPVTSGANTYSATPATQSTNVGGGATSNLTLTYVVSAGPPPPPGPLNLTIESMHVQQVVQTSGGTVPLVAGRDGLLRVFVKASTSNTVAPAVRVRFYNGTTLTNTITIPAPTSAVPTSPSQGTLTGSWNYLIPGASMVAGLKILADVDPTNTVVESSDADNSYPTSGTALSMDVRTLAAFDVRFVPVTQSVNSLTGGVTSGNAAQYLSYSNKVFPIGAVNMDVRAAYTTSAPILQNNDGNGAWSQVLSELNALRTADGSTKYYAGIAKVTYSSGIAGLGYLPGRASLSWDYLPSASEVVAHELGHNFGRAHAPCGGAGGPDPAYPYAGGTIGVYGYDPVAASLKAPTLTDLMGYCNTNWISDYTYVAVLNYRIANPFVAMSRSVASSTPQRGLLVWGRIRNGQPVLEPAYEVDAPPSLPTRAGPHRLQALGPLGESLVDLAFEGEEVGDLADPTARHFAFVIPMSMLRGTAPDRIRFESRGRSAERRSSAAAPGPLETPVAERDGARGLRVRWADRGIAGVLVRDAHTGEILSFARGGDQGVASSTRDVELTVSDGVRSTRTRVTVGPPRH